MQSLPKPIAGDDNEIRAVELANNALKLVASGRAEDGSRALREAASLAPQNRKVKEAFLEIQSHESIHILPKLCARFVLENDAQAGKDALDYLASSGQVPPDTAEECLALVSTGKNICVRATQDGIVARLLRNSSAAKAALATRLWQSPTLVFTEIYDIGDDASSGIATVVLDSSVWSKESVREACERDVFQLFLAKLMEAGNELDGRALRGISKLLATDAEKLHDLLDEDTFSAILGCLDYRLSAEVRSQATLVTAKYLEAADNKGRLILSKFISTRVARHNGEDLVLAFSAAAAIFPLVPSTAATLFLTEGFVSSLLPLLEKRSKSEKVEQAALEMLSAACIDTACREAIRKHLSGWLQRVRDTGQEQRPVFAAVILAKVRGLTGEQKVGENQDRKEDADDLVPMFKRLMANSEEHNKQSAVEGLAYVSVQPNVKEVLSSDQDFLKAFLGVLRSGQASSTILFGGLTIIDNLTKYLPVLSEEQRRISQLKAYANASKASAKADPLDEDTAVTKRCSAVVKAGTISTLVGISKSLSSTSTTIALNILLSLSRTSSHRGKIAQQGGIRFLLQLYLSATGQTESEIRSRRIAAHALARTLISVDPTLVFTSGPPSLISAIRPLLSLLTEDPDYVTEGPRDLLPTFESLLALTNLASTPSPEAAETIIRLAFPTIEDLQLGSNTMIRRASTELVCNLMTCPSGIEIFADESKAAARRLHILVALADVEDKATRRAAGGAMATLTEFESTVKGVLAIERGVEILLGLCEDEDEGILHRGVVCIRNLVSTDEPTGKNARDAVMNLRGVEILKAIINGTGNRGILELGVEALKELMQ